MNFRKSGLILGAVGALAALVVVGTAFAQTAPTPTQTPRGQTAGVYQEMFLDKLAAALGTTRDKLSAAFTQARNETADQAVKDGKLTQEQADRMKSRQGVGPMGFEFRGMDRGAKRPAPFMMGGTQVRDAIAQALGISSDELTTQLRSGKTLAELAQGKEQAVRDAVAAVVKPQLDQAVKDGKLTQEQADQKLNQIKTADLKTLGGFGGPRGMEKGMFRGFDGAQRPAPNPSSGGTVAPRATAL